ncbi:hypothetical protein BJ742DRAFT_909069 [Cladochytrium replicatum]|nr:hypothetical protein BJ742DRAFT_909069 [Cladochytrium replicatum]
MKKAVSNSKDRLAKSGSTKKRTPSGGVPNSGATGQQRDRDQDPFGRGFPEGGERDQVWDPLDLPVVIWPEWSDPEITAEKWATKHVFEDPDFGGTGGLSAPGPAVEKGLSQTAVSGQNNGQGGANIISVGAILPRSLRGSLESVKRPIEFCVQDGQTPVCITNSSILDDSFHSQSPASTGCFTRGGTMGGLPRVGSTLVKPGDNEFGGAAGGQSFLDLRADPIAETAQPASVTAETANPFPAQSSSEDGSDILGQTNSADSRAPTAEDSSQAFPNIPSIADPVLDEHKPDVHSPKTSSVLQSAGADEEGNLSGTSKLFQANKHLLGSDLMRMMLTYFHFHYEQSKAARAANVPDEFSLWDHIYPKGKDGMPSYNPSGKYCVKLFWLGAWRKIMVDDRIPLDLEGRPLVISSPTNHELWPMILSKAVMKVAAMSAVSHGTANTGSLGTADRSMLASASDTRESVIAPGGSTKDVDLTTTLRLLRIRSYFSCGTIRSRKSDFRGRGMEDTLQSPTHHEAPADMMETWLQFQEFVKTFRLITIFYHPSVFKFSKTIQHINDLQKFGESIRIPPVLYLSDPTKEAEVLISVSTFGKVRNELSPQGTSLLVEKWAWRAQYPSTPLIRMATNASSATCLRIPPGKDAFRFIVDSPCSFYISVYSKEDFMLEDEAKYATDRLGLIVREFDDTFPAQPASSWFILFKYILTFNEPTYLAANVYTVEALAQSTCCRAFDNDTNIEVPQVFFVLRPRVYVPNKSGYVFIADCKTLMARGPGKWKLRLIAEPNRSFSVAQTPTTSIPFEISPTKSVLHDFEDTYFPNKHNILFRSRKGKNAASSVKLQILDNNIELVSSKGKAVSTIHAFTIKSSSEPPPVSPDPKSPIPPMHKYIVQGSVDQFELSKMTASVVNNPEQIRPASTRGTNKQVSSARKKKSTTSAGTTPSAAQTVSTIQVSGAGGLQQDERTGNEPTWKLRIVSNDTSGITVFKDTEKEDRHKAIKDSWEQAQPGRALRARDLREAYAKSAESGSVRPITIPGPSGQMCKAWTIINNGRQDAQNGAVDREAPEESSPVAKVSEFIFSAISEEQMQKAMINDSATLQLQPLLYEPVRGQIPAPEPSSITALFPVDSSPMVLTEQAISERQAEDDGVIAKFDIAYEQLKSKRAHNKEGRQNGRTNLLERVEDKLREVEKYKEEDMSRREAYRQRIIREIEEANQRKTALELAKAAELADKEGIVDDPADKDKTKKKGAIKK